MRKGVGIFFLIILLTGCNIQLTPNVIQVSTDTPSFLTNTHATSSQLPTSIEVTEETKTPIIGLITPGLSVEKTTTIKRNCFDPAGEGFIGSLSNSGIIIANPTTSQTPIIMNLETHQRVDFPVSFENSNIFGVSESPNKEKLFFIEHVPGEEQSTLKVIDRDGLEIGEHRLPEGAMMLQWLNPEVIEANSSLEPGNILLMYLSQDCWTKKEAAFMNIVDTNNFRPDWLVSYSPDLEWAAYLDNSPGVTVWDDSTRSVIWKRSSAYQREPYAAFHIPPAWSPAGDQVAIYVSGQLTRIDRHGNFYTMPDTGDVYTRIAKMSWSPDGKTIALWNTDEEGLNARLLFLDVLTNQLVDVCLETDDFGGKPLIWSPESDKLIVEVSGVNHLGMEGKYSILIDRTRNQVIELLDDAFFIAWMK